MLPCPVQNQKVSVVESKEQRVISRASRVEPDLLARNRAFSDQTTTSLPQASRPPGRCWTCRSPVGFNGSTQSQTPAHLDGSDAVHVDLDLLEQHRHGRKDNGQDADDLAQAGVGGRDAHVDEGA